MDAWHVWNMDCPICRKFGVRGNLAGFAAP
jgi:hypothetical protein